MVFILEIIFWLGKVRRAQQFTKEKIVCTVYQNNWSKTKKEMVGKHYHLCDKFERGFSEELISDFEGSKHMSILGKRCLFIGLSCFTWVAVFFFLIFSKWWVFLFLQFYYMLLLWCLFDLFLGDSSPPPPLTNQGEPCGHLKTNKRTWQEGWKSNHGVLEHEMETAMQSST